MIAHEEAHANAGDKCLRSASTRSKIAELEQTTGSDVTNVRTRLHNLWTNFWQNDVLPAFEGKLTTPTSPKFWDYRFKSRWNHHALMGGREGGATSC